MGHRTALGDADAARPQCPAHHGTGQATAARQQRPAGHQQHLRLAPGGREAVPQREGQFHPGGTAADHRQPQPPVRQPRQCGVEPRGEIADGPHRQHAATARRQGARDRADIERQQVVAQRRVAGAEQPARPGLQPGRPVVHQSGAGGRCQAQQVDPAFLRRVEPRDQARQHAGIDWLDLVGDQRDAQAWLRPHGQAAQQAEMRMPATHQQQRPLPGTGDRIRHSVRISRHPSSSRGGPGPAAAG